MIFVCAGQRAATFIRPCPGTAGLSAGRGERGGMGWRGEGVSGRTGAVSPRAARRVGVSPCPTTHSGSAFICRGYLVVERWYGMGLCQARMGLLRKELSLRSLRSVSRVWSQHFGNKIPCRFQVVQTKTFTFPDKMYGGCFDGLGNGAGTGTQSSYYNKKHNTTRNLRERGECSVEPINTIFSKFQI